MYNQSEVEKGLERFKLAVENASDQIVITNKEGFIIYANKSLERVTGFYPDEVIGRKAGSKDLWGGMMEHDFYENLWRTIKENRKPFFGEIKNKRKDGSVYYALASISPVFDKKGEVQFFVSIERDITKEKEIDKAKTEFVSLASHQLRTPLSTISWYTEMLLNGDAGDFNEKQKEYLRAIYSSNKKLTEMVQSLLNVSKIELGSFSVEPEEGRIEQICSDTIKELEQKVIEKKILVKTDFAPGLPTVMIDKKLARMIFQNLFTNAIKYTKEGGEINIKIYLDEKKDYFVITFADNGYGIPKDEQVRVFEKLFRARNVKEKEVEGTGLGLYIVKSILDNSGGNISFDSIEGKGSTFWIRIPVSGMKKSV
jgi:PAS domain S-box-containing protein